MNESFFDTVVETMSKACNQAGDIVKQKYGRSSIVDVFNQYHVKLDVDSISHHTISQIIKEAFPSHAIISEEDENKPSKVNENIWIIDPLEGTNNYFLQIPYYGISIAYYSSCKPVATCLLEPCNNDFWLSVMDRGLTLNGVSIVPLAGPVSLKLSSISIVVDYTDQGLDYSNQLIALFSKKCKRVLTNWAPTIDLSRIALGLLNTLICIETPFENICAGLNFVKISGGAILNIDGSDYDFSDIKYDEKVSVIVGMHKPLVLEVLDLLKRDLKL